jgi:Protein of unknown function (DUF763)
MYIAMDGTIAAVAANPRSARLMARKAGTADLHGGHVPKWLADRMTRLGAVIVEAIIHHYGRDELLRRLAHPFWFQSFGAVMGMDWHSSRITTSVVGAFKRSLKPLAGSGEAACVLTPGAPNHQKCLLLIIKRQGFARPAALGEGLVPLEQR